VTLSCYLVSVQLRLATAWDLDCVLYSRLFGGNLKLFVVTLQLLALLLGLSRFSSFLILYTVGRTPWTGDLLDARLLPGHRIPQTELTRIQTSMPRVGFEPTTPAFERAKTDLMQRDRCTYRSKTCPQIVARAFLFP
jgi:hypothetical protein